MEFKEAFSLFDTDMDGLIVIDDVGAFCPFTDIRYRAVGP